MDLKETDALSSDTGLHWYYISKAKAIGRLLEGIAPARILDVGAGSAYFSRYLLEHTGASEAWCVDTGYESDLDDSLKGKAIHFRRRVDKIDADLILMMDVLEHVEDDAAFLREYAEKAPSGASFLITVPAFQFLWSGHDEFLGHRRRYTLDQVERLLADIGLDVRPGNYYFFMVFPIAALIRIAHRAAKNSQSARSQLREHHPIINAVLKFICSVELSFMRFNRLAGLSVLCLARKK